MIPFEALYGFAPPLYVPYLPGDSNVEAIDLLLRDRECNIQLLKLNLQRAAERIQRQANKHRVDRQLGSIEVASHHKFEPKFFGPYQVLDRIGKVAYRLNLSALAQIQNVFHVSQLRPSSPLLGTVPYLPTIPNISHIGGVVPQAMRWIEGWSSATTGQ